MTAVVVIASVLFALATPGDRAGSTLDRRLSSLRSTPDGALALYLTLEELGVSTDRRMTPYVDADPLPSHLALLEPTETLTPREVEAVRTHLAAGGTLIYAARVNDALLDALGLGLATIDLPQDSGGAIARPLPHRWTRGARPVSGFSWHFTGTPNGTPPGSPLLAVEDSLVTAIELRLGSGRVFVLSDGRPLRNGEILRSGVALLVARAAREMAGSSEPIVFDEFHHGVRGGSVFAAVGSFLVRHGAGNATLQMLAVLLLALLVAARRFGSPLPAPGGARRSPLEHVDALAQVYRQARSNRIPRVHLISGLARRLGRPRPCDQHEAVAMIERLEATIPSAVGAASQLKEALRSDERDLLAVSRGVDRLIGELKR